MYRLQYATYLLTLHTLPSIMHCQGGKQPAQDMMPFRAMAFPAMPRHQHDFQPRLVYLPFFDLTREKRPRLDDLSVSSYV